MLSPKLILLLSVVGFSAAQQTDPDAIEVCHNFFKGFMKAIKSEDLFQVLALFSPQPSDTKLDASQLIQQLKNLRVSFRGAHFVDSDISASVVFRPPKTELATVSATFVLEKNPATSVWTIKSMTDYIMERVA